MTHRIAWKVDSPIGPVWGNIHRTDDGYTTYCGIDVAHEFTDHVQYLQSCLKCEDSHNARLGYDKLVPVGRRRPTVTREQVQGAVSAFLAAGGTITHQAPPGDGKDLGRVNMRGAQ